MLECFHFNFMGDGRMSYYAGLSAGTPPGEFRNALDSARGLYDLSLAFAIATAGVHLLNVFDAFLSGTDYDSPTTGVGFGAATVPALLRW